MKLSKQLGTAAKWWMNFHRRTQHVIQNYFRITAAGDKRITAEGDPRVTADSEV